MNESLKIAIDALTGPRWYPWGKSIGRKLAMPRIIVMSDPSNVREDAITLDERVTSADLTSDHHSAQLIERVGWAVHDADDAEREEAARRP